MRCILFYHAFSSCWNNGNAHFLRGVTRELSGLGHEVIVYEPADGWSRLNAIRDGGASALDEVHGLFPGVRVRPYDATLDLAAALDGADLVIVHEWNPPELVERIGRLRIQGGTFTLLFHDTHHRAVTAPDELSRFDFDGYDGVLAFGEVLRQIYLRLGWADRAFTWHEAADTHLYRPLPLPGIRTDVVWIGNWGDDERSIELSTFLIEPIARLGASATVYGVRYPESAIAAFQAARIGYGGWLPAHHVPATFAAARATVHVPRGPYARSLPGIPTIRIFEAMACGIPLVSAPWTDIENLFPDGSYLRAANGEEMLQKLDALLQDSDLAAATASAGLRTVTERHTCHHRALELVGIVNELRRPAQSPRVAYQGLLS